MRRIPNILIDCKSDAERKLFELFDQVDLGSDWIVYHSLNCSEHDYKRWSEMEFLIVGPDGVFVLEVKGGGVSVRDGIWTYTDRFGVDHTNSEGRLDRRGPPCMRFATSSQTSTVSPHSGRQDGIRVWSGFPTSSLGAGYQRDAAGVGRR